MKRMISRLAALVLCAAFAVSLTACSGSSQSSENLPFANAQELLSTVWEADSAVDKPSVVGGLGDNMQMDVPQALNLSDTELLTASLNVPESLPANCSSAASIMNAMMANAFTVSVWQLNAGQSADDWAKQVWQSVDTAEWMCTFPEVCMIFSCGDYLIVVYGYKDQVSGFVQSVNTTLSPYGVKELYDEPIEG